MDIDDRDKEWYLGKYNQILLLEEATNKAEFVKADKSPKKDFVGVSSKDYNSESFSAGQDNLGQILTAILSFKSLKLKLGDKYQGGLILIDEIDSTLHADAQAALLETLCEAAEKYQLQIIGTTHSLFLLKHAFQSKIKSKVKVIYLKREDDNVIDSGYSTFEDIENNLKAQAQPMRSKRPQKVSLIFEDEVGRNMFSAIMGNTLNQFIRRVEMKSLGAGSLANLASLSLKVPELEKVILIPDGDVKVDLKVYEERSKNLIFLPGSLCPEALLYNCLKNLSDADPFWRECPACGYSRQVAITKAGKVPADPNEAKKWYKIWYNEQSKYWGRGNRKAFSQWAINNKELCVEFCREFFKILKRISPDAIPKEKTQSILGKYL